MTHLEVLLQCVRCNMKIPENAKNNGSWKTETETVVVSKSHSVFHLCGVQPSPRLNMLLGLITRQ